MLKQIFCVVFVVAFTAYAVEVRRDDKVFEMYFSNVKSISKKFLV